jgi:hypothetical protein
VLRRGDDQVPWTPGVEIAQILPRALLALVAIGVAPTTRTGVVGGVATAVKKLWLGSIRRAREAFRGIGPVYAGSWHTGVLRDNHGGASHIRRTVLACLHTTRFLYYSVSENVVLRDWLAPEGLLLASGESDLPQRIRFGKQWVKDQHGKVIKLRPDVLPFHCFVRWHIQRAHHHVEGILLDRALVRQRLDPLETNYEGLDAVMAQNMTKPPMDGFFIPGPEALLEAQTLIAALGRVASPRERELLFLLLDGASPQEAAAQLGIKRATVDVLYYNLKQKSHAL